MMELLLWLVNSGEEMVRGREGDREGGRDSKGRKEREAQRDGRVVYPLNKLKSGPGDRRQKTEDR